MMRTAIIELEPFDHVREAQRSTFEHIKSYSILEMLKIEWELGICVDLIECRLKEGISIDEIRYIGNIEVLSILRSEGDVHTCLIKYRDPEDSAGFKDVDMDLIFSTPMVLSMDKHTYSVIGEQANLVRFIEYLKKNVGTVRKMSFKPARYQKQDILSVLTPRQREILVKAQRLGYYDYPKKIGSLDLAEKVGLSRPTLLEHLRKAEGRLLSELLIGQTE